MKKQFFTCVLRYVIPIFFTMPLAAQSNVDTLSLAKNLRTQGKWQEAAQLLTIFQQKHNDVNAIWLLAQTESWLGHYKNSEKYYQKAINLAPNNDFIVIDYAKALLEMGNLEKSLRLLERMEQYEKKYSAAFFLKSKILYWKGDYPKAWQAIGKSVALDANNPEAWELWRNIRHSKATWLELNMGYATDNQPLKMLPPSISAGKRVNNWFSPFATLEHYGFTTDSDQTSAQRLVVGNTFSNLLTGFELKTSAGLVRFPNQKTDFTAVFTLKMPLFSQLSLDLHAAHQPFFATTTSVDSNLSSNHFLVDLHYENPKIVEAVVAYDGNQFSDKNNVSTVYAWAISPSLLPKGKKDQHFSLQLGYAFNYSDAPTNVFTPRKTVAQTLINYDATAQITGFYNPYFTPKAQTIHAAIVNFKGVQKNISFGASGSYGFSATTSTPYFYLTKNAANAIVFGKDYTQIPYTPFDVNAFLGVKIGEKYTLKASYTFQKTFFYESYLANVAFKMLLL